MKIQSLHIQIAILSNYVTKFQFFSRRISLQKSQLWEGTWVAYYKIVCWTTNSFVLGTGTWELKATEICKPKGGQFCRNPKTCRKPFVIYIPLSDPVHLNIYFAIFWTQLMLYFIDTKSYKKVKTTFWEVRSAPVVFGSLSQELPSLHIKWRWGGASKGLYVEFNSKYTLHFLFSADWTEAEARFLLFSYHHEELTEKAKGMYPPGINHSTESPILLQVCHLASLEPGLSHGSGPWCTAASLWKKGKKCLFPQGSPKTGGNGTALGSRVQTLSHNPETPQSRQIFRIKQASVNCIAAMI